MFACGVKAHRREIYVRILLGDNIGGGAVILLAITFRSVGIWIVTRLSSIYIGYVVLVQDIPLCSKYNIKMK
jgi:UPF0716 family protein affecting phage T7 exclusion